MDQDFNLAKRMKMAGFRAPPVPISLLISKLVGPLGPNYPQKVRGPRCYVSYLLLRATPINPRPVPMSQKVGGRGTADDIERLSNAIPMPEVLLPVNSSFIA